MIAQTLVRGLLMGIAIAAPVGPIAVIVIRRTLLEGRLAGLVCGLGCAAALALYGAVVGLAAVAGAVLACRTPLLIAGGFFLAYLGLSIARTPGTLPTATPVPSRAGLARAFAATFALTLVNPIVLVYFIATIATGGPAQPSSPAAAAPLVLGIFAGSALWWALLSGGVGLLRARLDARWLGWANRLSGVVIATLGARVLLQLI